MLTAKLSNEKVISLVDYERGELEAMRARELFLCRSCSERVILKLGTKRIFHFAHEKGKACSEDYDRESEYHMTGKIHLYDWLKEQGLAPELECYFSEIKQRADIAFLFQNKRYAVEFQCSTISEDLFKKRTAGYRKISVIPIWILGGKNIQRTGPQKTSLSSFHYLFLRERSDSHCYLPTYCPQAKKFILLEGITPISVRNAYCSYLFSSLDQFPIDQLLQPNKPFLIEWKMWRKEMTRFKTQLLANTTTIHDPFMFELYSQSLNPYFIPPYVGIPLRNNFAMETAPFVWQAYLFLDHFFQQKRGKEILFSDVYLAFLRRVKKGQIKTRTLPCMRKNQVPFAIREYLSFLADVGLLRKIKDDAFVLDNSVQIAKNMEEWTREEEKFYERESIWMNSHTKLK